MPSEFSVTADEVDAVTAWTVIRAARDLSRRLTEELAPLDLTPVEFGALVQLAAGGEHSQAELARAVGVRPQSMTPLVDALVRRGLAERGAAPGRGRASRLRLTRDGGELLVRAWPLVHASNAWFGDGGAAVVTTLRPFATGGTGVSQSAGVP